jgi:hypothetical protein
MAQWQQTLGAYLPEHDRFVYERNGEVYRVVRRRDGKFAHQMQANDPEGDRDWYQAVIYSSVEELMFQENWPDAPGLNLDKPIDVVVRAQQQVAATKELFVKLTATLKQLAVVAADADPNAESDAE